MLLYGCSWLLSLTHCCVSRVLLPGFRMPTRGGYNGSPIKSRHRRVFSKIYATERGFYSYCSVPVLRRIHHTRSPLPHRHKTNVCASRCSRPLPLDFFFVYLSLSPSFHQRTERWCGCPNKKGEKTTQVTSGIQQYIYVCICTSLCIRDVLLKYRVPGIISSTHPPPRPCHSQANRTRLKSSHW